MSTYSHFQVPEIAALLAEPLSTFSSFENSLGILCRITRCWYCIDTGNRWLMTIMANGTPKWDRPIILSPPPLSIRWVAMRQPSLGFNSQHEFETLTADLIWFNQGQSISQFLQGPRHYPHRRFVGAALSRYGFMASFSVLPSKIPMALRVIISWRETRCSQPSIPCSSVQRERFTL